MCGSLWRSGVPERGQPQTGWDNLHQPDDVKVSWVWIALCLNIWVWVNTYRYIFSGMNIHLPAILGFTRYQGFDPSPYNNIYILYIINGLVTIPKLIGYNPSSDHGTFLDLSGGA